MRNPVVCEFMERILAVGARFVSKNQGPRIVALELRFSEGPGANQLRDRAAPAQRCRLDQDANHGKANKHNCRP